MTKSDADKEVMEHSQRGCCYSFFRENHYVLDAAILEMLLKCKACVWVPHLRLNHYYDQDLE